MIFPLRLKARSSIFLIVSFSLTILGQVLFAGHVGANGEDKNTPALASLEETIQIALKYNPDQDPEEIIFSVKENYYLIQLKHTQLEVVDEVRGHFETAIEKAQEKMESDESDITQSQITKLKLGHAGALNDIVKHESASKTAKLTLGNLIGEELNSDIQLTDNKLVPLKFPYKTLENYLAYRKKNSSGASNKGTSSKESKGGPGQLVKRMDREKLFSLYEIYIELDKKRGIMAIAKKNRKITRALLITELANYDFGIGSSADLFEALMIYTRLLSGYYQTIYDFNLAIAKLEKMYSN